MLVITLTNHHSYTQSFHQCFRDLVSTYTHTYHHRWGRWHWGDQSLCHPSLKAAADRQTQTPGLWVDQSQHYASGFCWELVRLRRSLCPALVCSECISSASNQEGDNRGQWGRGNRKRGGNSEIQSSALSCQLFSVKFWEPVISQASYATPRLISEVKRCDKWESAQGGVGVVEGCERGGLKRSSNRSMWFVPGCPGMQIWGGWSGQRWWA